jgi:hypothetical protein
MDQAGGSSIISEGLAKKKKKERISSIVAVLWIRSGYLLKEIFRVF